MPLTPGEADRLLLFTQAELARARRARGLLMNVPESVALIADAICEWARDGVTLDEVRQRARTILSTQDVLPNVPDVVDQIRVEARFDDGMRLVVVADPFGMGRSSGNEAEHGLQEDRPTASAELSLTNHAATPIGISSHIHLAEVNPRLRLDRAAAFGMRPALATGDVLWIEPGQVINLPVTPIAGARVMVGNTGLVDGPLDNPQVRERALASLRACGYLDIVDGDQANDLASAEQAVAMVMRMRNVSDE
ncbi:MAG: urease subunit gamma [Actinomycetales bacterium]